MQPEAGRWPDFLWSLESDTVGLSGDAYLEMLAARLGELPGVAAVLISEIAVRAPDRVRPLAFRVRGRPAPAPVYDLAGTPCETVIGGVELIVAERVAERFPLCGMLGALGVDWYAGVPLRSTRAGVLGALCVMGERGTLGAEALAPLLRALGARAAAELGRHRADERLVLVCESITQVFWLTDIEKNEMVYISPAYETIWGRTCASLYEQPRSWLDSIHPEDRSRVMEAAVSKQASGTYDEEYRIVRPDGAVRSIRDRAFPIKDAAGRVTRVCGVAEDVTERRAAQAALAQSRDELAQAQRLDALGRLAGGVAHDFNNILTVVLSALALAREGLPEGSAVREELEGARQAALSGSRMTRRLLEFCRHSPVRAAAVDLNSVLGEADDMLRRIVGPLIDLDVRLAPGLPPVIADRSQFEQVVLNLVVNARDALPAGGAIRLETSLEQSGGLCRVCLSVTDTGIGMDEETQRRIFEPFFTTKGAQGVGLGLSTVYGIVLAAGGDITVKSAPGAGSEFRVRFPPAGPKAAADAAKAEAPARRRILVADGQEVVRRLATRLLGRFGYETLVAATAVEALSLIDGTVDAALVDLDLCDAASFFEEARGRQPRLRILRISGFTETAPDGPFLQKPFSEDELLRAVTDLLS
ncbi:MAG: PAS domain-containing protein [Elusimicrobia bacterium]|nr:PAS domain-containing protein [Elusimicrobiota bacterium]